MAHLRDVVGQERHITGGAGRESELSGTSGWHPDVSQGFMVFPQCNSSQEELSLHTHSPTAISRLSQAGYIRYDRDIFMGGACEG